MTIRAPVRHFEGLEADDKNEECKSDKMSAERSSSSDIDDSKESSSSDTSDSDEDNDDAKRSQSVSPCKIFMPRDASDDQLCLTKNSASPYDGDTITPPSTNLTLYRTNTLTTIG